jgi:hypothetical protein
MNNYNGRTMNKNVLITLGATAIMLVSCKSETEKKDVKINSPEAIQANMEFVVSDTGTTFTDDKIAMVYQEYQEIRKALINSDSKEVQTLTEELALNLTDDNFELESIVVTMATQGNLEKQREQFAQLTKVAEPIFIRSLDEGAIYKQFCPMAFNNKGGFWLSDASKINNPYYGDKMLKCGKIVETIKK